MHGGVAKSGYHTPASYKLKPNSSRLLGTRRQLRDKVGDKDKMEDKVGAKVRDKGERSSKVLDERQISRHS